MAIVVHTTDRQSASRVAVGAAQSITKPTNVVSGDLLRFIVMLGRSASGAGAYSVTIPTGFTEIVHAYRSGSNTGGEIRAGYKIAGASEPATYSFDAEAPSGHYNVVIDRITGHDPTTPIGNTSILTYLSTVTTITVDGLTATHNGSLLTACVAQSNSFDSTITADSPLTSSINFTGSYARSNVAHQNVDSGATGTRSWTFNPAASGAAAMFAINPASTASSSVDLQNLHRGFGPARAAGLGGILQ